MAELAAPRTVEGSAQPPSRSLAELRITRQISGRHGGRKGYMAELTAMRPVERLHVLDSLIQCGAKRRL